MLRASKALTVSLVAEKDGRAIGHIAFSPVTISDCTPGWNGLGPVSVFFALSFDGHAPQGAVSSHEGFKAGGRQEGGGEALQRN